MEQQKQRNPGLDFLRYLCAFFVVLLHMPFPFEQHIEPVIRLMVPIFAMITGYFYESTYQKGKTLDQIKKIARLLLYAYLLYFVWDMIYLARNGQSFGAYMRALFHPVQVAKFLACNASLLSGHLWYLGALLYGLVILYFADRFHIREKLYKWIPVFFLLNLVLGTYSVVLLGFRAPVLLTRNFLLFILPFLLLGDWLRKKQPAIPNRYLIAGILLSAAVVLGEKQFLLRNFTEFNEDFLLGIPTLAAFAFLLALNNGHRFQRGIPGFFAKLGRKTATTVYIIHILVMTELDQLVAAAAGALPWVPDVYYVLGPVIVMAVSTILSAGIHRISAGRKQNKNKGTE